MCAEQVPQQQVPLLLLWHAGQPTYEYTYVESNITEAPYFASKCKLSTEGELRALCCCFRWLLHLLMSVCMLHMPQKQKACGAAGKELRSTGGGARVQASLCA